MTYRILGAMALLIGASAAIAAEPMGTMTVTNRIAGPDGGWDYASVDVEGNRLFVARTDGVMTIDLASKSVTPDLVKAGRTHAAFVIAGTHIGIVTSGELGGVRLFNSTNGALIGDIKTGKKPDAAVYDVASKTLLVMDNADGIVSIVDPVKAKLVGTIAVGGALEFAAVDGKGHLFVNVEDKGELAMLDINTRAVVRRTALVGCEEPSGLALTKAGILISACANGVAKTSDAATGKLLADVAIGLHPDAVLYDATRDRAYIPSGGDGTLTVIDTAGAIRAIGTVVTQRGARTGAVDPATGTVYLPVARYAPAQGVDRPKPVPGSFEVLVVGQRG